MSTKLDDLHQQLEFLGIEKAGSLLQKLKKSRDTLGSFTFLMRAVMMRHSQKQTYRDTPTTLMSLPPKVKWCCCCCFVAAVIAGGWPHDSETSAQHSLTLLFDSCLFVHRHTVLSLSIFLLPIEPNTILLRRLHAPTTSP
jgi:hypothetical protein